LIVVVGLFVIVVAIVGSLEVLVILVALVACKEGRIALVVVVDSAIVSNAEGCK
jgi:hypothetical protein